MLRSTATAAAILLGTVAGSARADDVFVSGIGSAFRFDLLTGGSMGAFTSGRGIGFPGGVAVGPGGDLYIGDQATSQVLRFDGATGVFVGVFVPEFSGGLTSPEGLEFGPDGHLYVANHEAAGAVLRYDGDTGTFLDVFASGGGLTYPTDIEFRNGRLHVVSGQSNQVLRYDATSGQFIDAFITTSAVDFATGIAFAGDGRVLLAGYFSHNVARFDGATGAFIDEFIPPAAGLDSPSDIDLGPDGDLYVVSTGPEVVMRFDGVTGEAVDVLLDPGLFLPWYLAFSAAGCYADCDASTGPGVLDIFDFLCFQNAYTLGDPYACDCDTSTGLGVCDVFDFLCFQNAYAVGCP